MKKIISFLLLIFCVLILPASLFATSDWVNLDLTYDGKTHNYSAEKVTITLDDEPIINLNMEPIIFEGRTLVPLRGIFEEMGSTVLWDANNKKITIKNNNNTIVFKIGSNIAVKNSTENIALDVPARIINNHTMVPIRAISDALDYSVDWNNTTRNISIKNLEIPTTEISTGASTETIVITTEPPTEVSTEPIATNQKQDGIKILWDQTYQSTNDNPEKRVPIEGLDVLSPTWFEISNVNGDVLDKGSTDYANWAKEQGYELWGLISNKFDPVITTSVLSDSVKRKKVIDQMITYAKKYDLDGINIDFEGVAKTDGDIYLQFIKEATAAFKANGLVTSVATFVPTPWTQQYKLKEVGETVDYVIIMAYDEHYRTSPASGSTASLPWVKKYMDEAVKLVDKDKLIMGIPFYTRIWSEQKQADGSVKVVESLAATMEDVEAILQKTGAKVTWLGDTKQHYIEYTEDGLTKKIWIEDEASMKERMELSRKYNLKGVAAWKRNFETDGIWDVINSYYK